jgi:hypothetical protein
MKGQCFTCKTEFDDCEDFIGFGFKSGLVIIPTHNSNDGEACKDSGCLGKEMST